MSKIIVIDDEESICALLCKLFESDGYEVKTETNSEKALELILKENPDCILCDIKMPKIDGIELLSKIKEVNKDMPVIMITGYGRLENAMETMKLGAYDYITKPFDLDFIKTVVKNSLIKDK